MFLCIAMPLDTRSTGFRDDAARLLLAPFVSGLRDTRDEHKPLASMGLFALI